MELFLWCLGTGFATAGWCVARLRGDRTVGEALRRVIPFGGPRPTTPK